MKYVHLLDEAKQLRVAGQSYAEIATKLGVAKSTVSLWLRDVNLTTDGRQRLLEIQRHARSRSRQTQHKRHERSIERIRTDAQSHLQSVQQESEKSQRLICAMIYWCEGSKSDRRVTFTNSDPALVKYFLTLLRASFALDERKFRVVIHLHEYHHESKQRSFWSKTTGIAESQFSRIYRKPHTGKNKRRDYPGCVSVRYYDTEIVDYLMTLAQLMMRSN